MDHITPFNAELQDIQSPQQLAVVIEESMGNVLSVKLTSSKNNDQVFTVREHINTVQPLSEGDRVLVLMIDDEVIVLGKLREKHDIPTYDFYNEEGVLYIQADKGIMIKTGDSKIELTASGKIKVDGKNIYSISEGRHRLQGSTIELN